MTVGMTAGVLSPTALAGKVALVTGAARGIGRAIALEMARAGADVAINDLDPGQPAEEVAGQIRAEGRRVSIHQADVANRASVEAMFDQIETLYGQVDILINNAGMQVWEPFLDITEGPLQRILDVDLKGVIYCSQVAARRMVAQGIRGRVINISSVHAVYSIKSAAVYDAAKAGVMRLTMTAALELAPHGITLNAIGPGWMDTPLAQPFIGTPEGPRGDKRDHPHGARGPSGGGGHALRLPGLGGRCLHHRRIHRDRRWLYPRTIAGPIGRGIAALVLSKQEPAVPDHS